MLIGAVPRRRLPVGRQFEEGIFRPLPARTSSRNGSDGRRSTDRGGFLRRGFRRFRRRGLRGRPPSARVSEPVREYPPAAHPPGTHVRASTTLCLTISTILPLLSTMTLPARLTLLMKLRLMKIPVSIQPPTSRISVPESPDMRAQQGRSLDAESAAPPRRTAEAPAVGEGESQRQRPEDHNRETAKGSNG